MPLREHAIEPWANLTHAQKAARYQGLEQMAARIIELMPSFAVRDAATEIQRICRAVAGVHVDAALADEATRTAALESAPFKKCGDLAGQDGFDLVRFVGYHDTYLCLLLDRKSGVWIVTQWDHINNHFLAGNSFDSYNDATTAYDDRKAL